MKLQFEPGTILFLSCCTATQCLWDLGYLGQRLWPLPAHHSLFLATASVCKEPAAVPEGFPPVLGPCLSCVQGVGSGGDTTPSEAALNQQEQELVHKCPSGGITLGECSTTSPRVSLGMEPQLPTVETYSKHILYWVPFLPCLISFWCFLGSPHKYIVCIQILILGSPSQTPKSKTGSVN